MTARTAYRLCRRADAFRLAWDAAQQSARRPAAGPFRSRAIHGFVEPIIRHGKVWGERHRFDNRHTMAVLTRLDRSIAANRQRPGRNPHRRRELRGIPRHRLLGRRQSRRRFHRSAPPGRPLMATMTFATFTPKVRPQWQPSISRLLPFLPGTGRGTMRSMVEGSHRCREDPKEKPQWQPSTSRLYPAGATAMAGANRATFTRRSSRRERRRVWNAPPERDGGISSPLHMCPVCPVYCGRTATWSAPHR